MSFMTPEEQAAYHQASWDEYNRRLLDREDDYDEINAKIYDENYYAKDAVSITMSTDQWDMVRRLCQIGWGEIQKLARAT